MPTQNPTQIINSEKREAAPVTWQEIVEQDFPAVVEGKLVFGEFLAKAETLTMEEIARMAEYIGDPDNYGADSAVTDEARQQWLEGLNKLVIKKDRELRAGSEAAARAQEEGQNVKPLERYDGHLKHDLAARRRSRQEPVAGLTEAVPSPQVSVAPPPKAPENAINTNDLTDLTEKLGGGGGQDAGARNPEPGTGEVEAEGRIPVATFDAAGNEVRKPASEQDDDEEESPYESLIAPPAESRVQTANPEEIRDADGRELVLPDQDSVETGSLLPTEAGMAEPGTENPEPVQVPNPNPQDSAAERPKAQILPKSPGVEPPIINEDRDKSGFWQKLKGFAKLGGRADALAAHELEQGLGRGVATPPIPANPLESIAGASPETAGEEKPQQAA
ncbi:MAG: hypothetical protein AAB360_01540 [Patescibacteria group bacterium]